MKKALLLTLVICLTAVPIYADEKDDRIAALEEKVAELEERIAAIEAIFTMDFETSGEFYISNESGSTEYGDEIILYASPEHENDITSLGITSYGLDGSILTYIYVDDELNSKEQLADSMSSIYISGDALSEGKHKVKAVQYADNDEGGEILFEKTEEYEVKYK